MTTVAVVVGGLALLVALATVIGTLVDRGVREAAWRGIAAARRANHEKSRELYEREVELDAHLVDLDARERRLLHREQALDVREDSA